MMGHILWYVLVTVTFIEPIQLMLNIPFSIFKTNFCAKVLVMKCS